MALMLLSRSAGVGVDFTDAIRDSLVFIACIGSTFWENTNCMHELKFAGDEGKRLIFVILPSHPAGKIHETIRIMMGNSLCLDLRDLSTFGTAQQDDFARRVAEYAAAAAAACQP